MALAGAMEENFPTAYDMELVAGASGVRGQTSVSCCADLAFVGNARYLKLKKTSVFLFLGQVRRLVIQLWRTEA